MSKKILNYVAPPALAITSGATTPNPGIAGISVWSTIEQKMVTWNGTSWISGGITLGSSAAVDIAIASSPGAAVTAARSDHVHAHGNLSVGNLHALATGSLHGFMSSADFTKLAGIAAGATATPLSTVNPSAVSTAAAIGSSIQAAKADHVHAHGAQPLGDGTSHAVVNGTTAGFMSSADYTKLAGIAPGAGSTPLSLVAPPAIQVTGAVGTSSSVARGDHVHAHGAQTDGTLHGLATGSLNGFMSPAQFTKLAGIATGATATTLSTTTPTAIGVTGAAGSGTSASKFDHVHAHGVQTDGTLHALATGSVNGFMSAADFTKLAGIAAGATAAPYGSTTPTTLSLTATGAVGVATAISRADHTHPHGNQTITTLHAVATGSANGFLSSANFTKLAGIPLTTVTSAGAGDVGKIPVLDSTGRIDASLASAGSFDVSQNTITFTDQAEQLNTATTGAKLYVANFAERRMLVLAAPNSAPMQPLQPCLGTGHIAVWNPAGSAGAGFGFLDVTVGTIVYATGINSGSNATISTGSANNSLAYLRNAWGVSRTFGFHYIAQFQLATVATRWFVGLSSAPLGSGDPAAQPVNLIGFGQETGDSLISIITSTAVGGQQVKVPFTGWPTPTPNTSTYEAHIFCSAADTTKVGYMLRRIQVTPNVIVSGIISTGLPDPTVTVNPIIWLSNGLVGDFQIMRLTSQYHERY